MTAEPLYSLRFDPGSFALSALSVDADGTYRHRDVSSLELLRRLCESEAEIQRRSSVFYLACLVLRRGETDQRRAVQRLRAPNSRNIRINSRSIESYFADTLPLFYPAWRLEMEYTQLNQLLTDALKSLKQKLRLPTGNRLASCYTLTEKMYQNSDDEGFKQAVDQFVTSVGIPTANKDGTLLYVDDLQRLHDKIEAGFPKQWKALEKIILQTESREHLSAISLATGKVPGVTYISLANTHGNLLTMESWKFVALLEKHDTPHKLTDLVEQKRQEPDSMFAFNLHREGEIFAQLYAQESILRVVCRSTKNHEISGRANFIIDIDYALCLYIALKRLREDSERFARLKEKTNSIVCPEVFERLFH